MPVCSSAIVSFLSPRVNPLESPLTSSEAWRKWRIGVSPSAPGVALEPLELAIAKKDSDAVKEALNQLNGVGWARRWSSQPYMSRRPTSLRELTTLGIKNAENLAIPSVRNDAALLFTVVGVTGFLSVLAGQLPGDWGFFVPYLIGSIPLVVLGIGSISPGLLQAAIDGFSSFFPEYQERIARHEAAHFLVAYLLGFPILDYSLDIGKEHVNLGNEKLQKLLYAGNLDDKELDRLAVVSMAGLAAEGLKYDKIIGQSADLFTLQRIINRSGPKLTKEKQKNLTRWAFASSAIVYSFTVADEQQASNGRVLGLVHFTFADSLLQLHPLGSVVWIPNKVLFAGSLLKNNRNVHEALMSAMLKKSSVLDCIRTIENTS